MPPALPPRTGEKTITTFTTAEDSMTRPSRRHHSGVDTVCLKCHKAFRRFSVGYPQTCSACNFVDEAIASIKTSCGQFRFSSYRIWCWVDAAERFETLGWTAALQQPTPRDVFFKTLTLTLKSTDLTSCKGKPEWAPRCHATANGALPTPAAIHAIKQDNCRRSCPIGQLPNHNRAVDALTLRCCEMLALITVDPVSVVVNSADAPALIGTMHKLAASGWRASLSGGNSRFSVGTITIYPETDSVKG